MRIGHTCANPLTAFRYQPNGPIEPTLPGPIHNPSATSLASPIRCLGS